MPAPEALLTPNEVCEWLRVTKDWLYDECQAGRIPCVRVGQRLRFRRQEIEEYLTKRNASAVK